MGSVATGAAGGTLMAMVTVVPLMSSFIVSF